MREGIKINDPAFALKHAALDGQSERQTKYERLEKEIDVLIEKLQGAVDSVRM